MQGRDPLQRVWPGVARASEGADVKRRLLTILILLLAGAVVNVGVAWGCAWRSQLRTGIYLKIDDWHLTEYARQIAQRSEGDRGFCLQGRGIDVFYLFGFERAPAARPVNVMAHEAGLPLRSVFGESVRRGLCLVERLTSVRTE